MKNFRKIIALFIVIFIAGVLVIATSVNTTLNKSNSDKKVVEIKKDTTHLIKTQKQTV